jgi:hypothetical protein
VLSIPLRRQIVYDASLFPVETMRITELRLRPSAWFGGAFSSTISNLQINLSTTSVEPDHLNATFAQNVGPDEVVVFQGPLIVSSGFVGPMYGPKEFDIIIPLSTPFVYDPGRGNLLVDIRNASGSSATHVDTGTRTDDGASCAFATSADATVSTGVNSGAEVFQIVYTQISNLQVGITNVSGSGRTLALTFNGPAGNYAIEASTNLMDWVTLTNIVDMTGQVRMTDPAINSLRWRFYRARLAP